MPPELARGEPVGPTADVYGLGAILYEVVTGRPPIAGEDVRRVVSDVLCAEPESPSKLGCRTPLDLSAICLKCLEKNPRRRYTSAQELADDLGRFLELRPVQARQVGRVERIRKWCLRSPFQAASVGLLFIALTLGAVTAVVGQLAFYLSDRKDKAESARYGAQEETQRQTLNAQHRHRREEVRRLAERAKEAAASNPQLSLLLAVEAVLTTTREGEPCEPAAEEVLRYALANCSGRGLSGHKSSIHCLAISPNGYRKRGPDGSRVGLVLSRPVRELYHP